MDIVKVGIAAISEGTQQIQRRRRLMIALDQALRIGNPRVRREVHAVDIVAAIGRQGDAIDGFDGRRTRLAELTGNAPDLDDRTAAGKG